MFKVYLTNAVVSKGYDKNPALNFSENGKSVRFRIGKGLYDPNAENNTRWLNKTVKAFDSVCEKIKNMKLSGKFIPILHEYVLIVRKDNPLLIPIIQVKKKDVDIRDMEGASWRDIVAAVLEQHDDAVSLESLYQEIEPYKKTKTNQWWKEKIRQTLQINPKYFLRTGRGMWKLVKEA